MNQAVFHSNRNAARVSQGDGLLLLRGTRRIGPVQNPRGAKPRGFTLVELLCVMAIIAILATAMISALWSARETAKKARTRQLIEKIHEQIMPRWEAYKTRRLPVTVPTSIAAFPQTSPPNPYVQNNQYGKAVAWFKLWALRELMRMEMPDRYDDLTFSPRFLINQVIVNGQPQAQPVTPDMKLAYLQRIASLQGLPNSNSVLGLIQSKLALANGPAECLYLVVTTGSVDQELLAMSFNAADTGDTDGDGIPEFLDGWGNPISFLRWAPGFGAPSSAWPSYVQSDLQPVYSIPTNDPGARQLPAGLPKDPNNPNNLLTHFPVEVDVKANSLRYSIQYQYVNNHDGFDPLEVDPMPVTAGGRPNVPERGYNLIPLIFSAGPNGSLPDMLGGNQAGANGYGLYSGTQLSGSQSNTPQCADPFNYFNGSDTNGQSVMRGATIDGTAFDNIHNHLIGQR